METSVMYRMRPILDLPDVIDLPTCMYSMRNIYETKTVRSKSDDIVNGIMDKGTLPDVSSLEKRLDSVLSELSDLVSEVSAITKQLNLSNMTNVCQTIVDRNTLDNLKGLHGAVINANPERPPYALFLIKQMTQNVIGFSSHTHSSVPSLPAHLSMLCQSNVGADSVRMTLIWKADLPDTELVLNPVKHIPVRGEVNILRHLGRSGLGFLHYPAAADPVQTVQIDSVLDMCHRLTHTQASKEVMSLCRNLNGKLGRSIYFGGDEMNVADLATWSSLKQIGLSASQYLTPNMAKWYKRMDDKLRI